MTSAVRRPDRRARLEDQATTPHSTPDTTTARRRPPAAAVAVAARSRHPDRGPTPAAPLIADARASGIRVITAPASGDNPAAGALLRRASKVRDIRLTGLELSFRAAIG